MKKQILMLACVCVATLGWSQKEKPKTYSVPFSGTDKKVVIYSGSTLLNVEGYDGKEVVIEVEKSEKEIPEEAEGLKLVSGGTIDNTGIGASANVEGNVLKIKIPFSKFYGNFKIKIPKELAVSVKESRVSYGKWFISGLDGEVEATTSYSEVTITDVSGPIVARAGWKSINVIFDKLNPTKPSSISANRDVKITLPADSKANLKLQSGYGDVFTDFDIAETKPKKAEDNENEGIKPATKVREVAINGMVVEGKFKDMDKKVKEMDNKEMDKRFKDMEKKVKANFPDSSWAKSGSYSGSGYANAYSSDDDWSRDDSNSSNGMNGTINGGGVKITIRSDFGNIFLRKKK